MIVRYWMLLTGAFSPQGSLSFDAPRSMESMEQSRPDVPFDTGDQLFRSGHGLHY